MTGAVEALLDVNVLLALFDADHVDHVRAHRWLDGHLSSGGRWASCPVTENGFVRIISQPRYPSPVSTATAVALLAGACAAPEHAWWPCDASILDERLVDRSRLLGHRQVTDASLLLLAVQRDGLLVTFDRALSLEAVRGAREAHRTVL